MTFKRPEVVDLAGQRITLRQVTCRMRDGLIAGRLLRDVEVTAAMPKARPWRTGRCPD